MQAEYAEWREPNPDRPWIASVRHAMRTMTLGDWLVCAAIVSYNVVTASFSKTEGGFFTGDVAGWRLAKALSLPTSIIFPILSLSLMGLAFWMLLRIDLLLWRRRGRQNKRGEV